MLACFAGCCHNDFSFLVSKSIQTAAEAALLTILIKSPKESTPHGETNINFDLAALGFGFIAFGADVGDNSPENLGHER